MLEPPMEDKNNSISHGERIILGGLILLFVVKGIERLWSWIQSPRHFILVAGLLLLVLIPVGKILWDKIKKKREKTLFEKTITAQIDDSVFVELLITEKISGLNHDKGLCTHKSSGRLMLVKLKV
jgi:hypothetical protein